MSFALPLGLLFFGLFIPITALYLLKQRRDRNVVPTLLFWNEALQSDFQIASWNQIRKWLSLLLQLIIVALLALALAQPVLSSALLEGRRIVLLLDCSASMTALEDGKRRFDLAREHCRTLVEGLGAGDLMMVVQAGARPAPLTGFTRDTAILLDALDRAAQEYGEADFSAAADMLRYLPQDERETVVYVVSDRAFNAIPADRERGFRLASHTVGSAVENTGITQFALRPLTTGEPEFELFFEIFNATSADQSVPYSVLFNGGVMDADRIEVPAGSRVRGFKRLLYGEGGVLTFRLDLEDAFLLDNSAVGVLPPPEKIPVVLVSDGNTFLEAALYADSHLSVRNLWIADWSTHTPSTTSVYVFDRWAPGGDPVARGVYLGVAPGGTQGAAREPLANPMITAWKQEHAVSRHLTPARLRIDQALVLNMGGGDTVLASSFTSPLILARETDTEHAVIFGFDLSAGDWPLQVAYPLMISDAIRSVAGPGATEKLPLFRVNDTVDLAELGAQDLGPDTPIQLGHTGGAVASSVLFPGGRGRVDTPGVYSIADGTETRPLLAVNLLDADESRIGAQDGPPFLELEEEDAGILAARRGGNPAWLLALAGMALLVSEWFLFQRRWIE